MESRDTKITALIQYELCDQSEGRDAVNGPQMSEIRQVIDGLISAAGADGELVTINIVVS